MNILKLLFPGLNKPHDPSRRSFTKTVAKTALFPIIHQAAPDILTRTDVEEVTLTPLEELLGKVKELLKSKKVSEQILQDEIYNGEMAGMNTDKLVAKLWDQRGELEKLAAEIKAKTKKITHLKDLAGTKINIFASDQQYLGVTEEGDIVVNELTIPEGAISNPAKFAVQNANGSNYIPYVETELPIDGLIGTAEELTSLVKDFKTAARYNRSLFTEARSVQHRL